MSESDYNDSFDNEKIQKFTEFDKNMSNKYHNLLSHIDKNKDILQVRQKAVIQKKMKISQNLQKFQADHIIRFTSKNVQICVDSRKN